MCVCVLFKKYRLELVGAFCRDNNRSIENVFISLIIEIKEKNTTFKIDKKNSQNAYYQSVQEPEVQCVLEPHKPKVLCAWYDFYKLVVNEAFRQKTYSNSTPRPNYWLSRFGMPKEIKKYNGWY